MFLPSRLYLLLLTRSSHLYPDLSWLRLHAWRLSSAFHEQLASPPLSRSSLHWRAVHPRSQCIGYIGPFIMGSVHSNGHSIYNPTLAMVADSCVPSGTPEAWVCPPCGVTVQFYLRFSVFTFHPYLRIRCFGCCSAPSNSLQRSVCYVPILGTCLWCCLSSLTGL